MERLFVENGNEIVGEHFLWIKDTSEIENLVDGSRRSDSAYNAKVDVYEDRVRFWFLEIAKSLVKQGQAPGDYVALSIALAYIEGVEQYRQGKRTPRRMSGEWFRTGVLRIFPRVTPELAERLWVGARNGLFHDGFTKGPILLSHGQHSVMVTRDRHVIVNPATFVGGVIADFDAYVQILRSETAGELAKNFTALWDEQWNAT